MLRFEINLDGGNKSYNKKNKKRITKIKKDIGRKINGSVMFTISKLEIKNSGQKQLLLKRENHEMNATSNKKQKRQDCKKLEKIKPYKYYTYHCSVIF